MKRTMSRKLRFNAEMMPIAEHDSAYLGKHESIAEIFAELESAVAEMARKLNLTDEYMAEFIAETTAPAREIAERVTERISRNISKYFPAPVWKMCGKEVIPYAGIV